MCLKMFEEYFSWFENPWDWEAPARTAEPCQEQCREAKGQPKISQYAAYAEEPEKAASFTVLDGLKGCEAALTAMDRRVTNLEDCLEESELLS